MDWSANSIQYLAMKEVHLTFLECFLKTAASFTKPDDGKYDAAACQTHQGIVLIQTAINTFFFYLLIKIINKKNLP